MEGQERVRKWGRDNNGERKNEGRNEGVEDTKEYGEREREAITGFEKEGKGNRRTKTEGKRTG